MAMHDILQAVFEFKNKETRSDGVLQKIFQIIHSEREKTPHIFDFHETCLSLTTKQSFTIEGFRVIYSSALQNIFPSRCKTPIRPTKLIIAQIFFITLELLKITSFRLTPDKYGILVYRFQRDLGEFIDRNFSDFIFEAYLQRLKVQKTPSFPIKNCIDFSLISVSVYLIYLLS